MTDFDFDARRAAHRRGHGVPLHNRVLVDRNLSAKPVYLDVRNYLSAGDELTQDNFQDTFEAAYADAVLKSRQAVSSFAGASPALTPNYQVLVPEGLWKLTRTIVIPSAPAASPEFLAPGISGTSTYGTGFIVNVNDFTATNNVVISVGDGVDDAYALFPLLEKFNIQFHGSAGTDIEAAICLTIVFGCVIRDVAIFGCYDTNNRADRGWGVKILDVGTSTNNQYTVLENVRIQACSGGVYVENCLPLILRGVYSKQNIHYDHVFSGCVVSVDGGSVESGIAPVASPLRLSKGQPRIMTGWDVVAASGTGAAVATAVGDLTTVTGLSGMTRDADVNRWLYLEKSSGAYDGSDKVSGYYLIVEYISSTSVKIRKGSSHAATSSLIWSTREASQIDLEIGGMLYHEGECFAGVGLYAITTGSGSCNIRNCNMANCDFVVESLGSPDHLGMVVKIDGADQASEFIKARFVPSIVCLDADYRNIGDVDEYSREGLIMRDLGQTYGGPTAFTASGPGAIHTSRMPSGSARTMCKLYGANAVWDARVASSFNKSGADITSWTDLTTGIVASLANAAKYPQYSASDATFGGKPSVTFTGGTAANTCGLVATIPSAKWDAHLGAQPCLVVVAAIPSAAELVGDVARHIRIVSGASAAAMHLAFATAGMGTKYGCNMYPPGDNQVLAADTDTAAHVFIFGGAGRARPHISSELETQLMSSFVVGRDDGWAQADAVLRFQDNSFAASTSTLSVAFVASFPFGLGADARDQLMDALCSEFGISR